MARFLCYATENKYGGHHGIENTFVIDEKDILDARANCFQACLELMDSYANITEELREDAKFYLGEELSQNQEQLDEAFWECQCENACPQVWKVDEEKAKGFSTHELDIIACNYGYKDFLEKYCIQEN